MDLISDMLTRIRNSSEANKKEAVVPKNKTISEILRIIKSEGFISDFKEEEGKFVVTLKYVEKEPVISKVKRVSCPGRRMYMSSIELKPVLKGRGVGIISTSKGVMTIDEAKAQRLGGEYICYIW